MRYKGLLLLIAIITLIVNGPIPCQAAEIEWSGSLLIEESFQDSNRFHMNVFNLETGIFTGEKESGAVLLQLKAPGWDLKTSEEVSEEVGYILDVHQAYIDLLLTPNALLRAGRQKISWGSGFTWNPTNYLGAKQNRADFMVDRPGVDALDLEYNRNNTLMALVIKPEDSWHATGKAFKASWWLGGADLSLSCFQQGEGRGLGAELGMTVGETVIYGEAAAKARSHRFYIHDHSQQERCPDRLYLHALVGAHRFFDTFTLMVEYYHNQEGWNRQEAEAFFDYLETMGAMDDSGVIAALAVKKAELLAELGQNYLSCAISKTGLVEDLTLSGSILWNVGDQSYQARPAVQYDFSQNTYLEVSASLNYGNSRTEFGSLPFSSYISAKLAFHF